MALISKKRSSEIAAKAEERGGGARAILPMGVHLLTITDVVGKHTKSNLPMVVVTYEDKAQEFPKLNEYFVIKDDGPGAEILGARLKPFGAHDMGEIETLDDLVKYVAKNMKGKTLKAAIAHDQRIYKKAPGEWYLNTDPRVAYVGSVEEDMSFDESKGLKMLTPPEQKEWDAYVASRNNAPGTRSVAATKEEAPVIDEEDDLGILDTKPKKAAASKKEVTEVTEEPAEDDGLSFLND